MNRYSSSLLVLLSLVISARAHDFWIELSDFSPTNDELVRVELKVGENFQGQPVVRDERQIESFVAGTNTIIGRDGRDPAGFFKAHESAVIGYRSRPTPITLEPLKFEEYLWKEGLENVIAARHGRGEAQAPGREIFSRCAKALLSSGDDFSQPLGFRLELVPETRPQVGSVAVKLIFENAPCPGALIVAINKEDPALKLMARSDSNGRAVFEISKPGTWLIKAVHMIPAAHRPDADWESLWASLTFKA